MGSLEPDPERLPCTVSTRPLSASIWRLKILKSAYCMSEDMPTGAGVERVRQKYAVQSGYGMRRRGAYLS